MSEFLDDPPPEPMPGETGELQTFFREFAGFTGVVMEHISLPEHVLDFFKGHGEQDDDLEELKACTCYWRVTTDQGVFGLMRSVYPLIDLHGTGLTAGDLYDDEEFEDLGDDADEARSLFFVGMESDEAFMRRFKDKLALQKR